jgi:adenylate cyclase
MGDARRLAAILAVDVVGYSRMMGEDESGTAKAVRELRRAMVATALSFGGRLVKTTGDGALFEFPSVVAAVNSAISIQKHSERRNLGVPEDKQIRYRMGVNLGEVIVDGDDILGDGVNVAARLESMAEPGGLCLSSAAKDYAQGCAVADFADLGEKYLKNITKPVRVFGLSASAVSAAADPSPAPMDALAPPKADSRRGLILAIAIAAGLVLAIAAVGVILRMSGLGILGVRPALEDKLLSAPRLSIVVLPFTNLSNDPEQEFFADALTDDLTTDLSHLPDSFVIARNTAFTYKGKSVDVKQVGRELGVRYVLEGSVRPTGDKITVNAQLISGETGAHVWADRFEGDRSQLGQLQLEAVSRLARSLGVELVKAESLRTQREGGASPDAADLAMQGWAQYNLPHSRESIGKAIDLFEHALTLDPNQTRAMLGLAMTLSIRASNFWSQDRNADLQRGTELANKILASQPDNAFAHLAKALALGGGGQWEAAIAETGVAIEDDRNLAGAYADHGFYQTFVGRSAQGIAPLETALKLSPRDPLRWVWEYWLCHLHSHLGQWRDSIDLCRKAIADNPSFWLPYADLAAAYAWLGQADEAKVATAQLLKLKPDMTANGWVALSSSFSKNATFTEEMQRFAEGLRKAGLPEGGAP